MQPIMHGGKPAVSIKCYKGPFDVPFPLDLGTESSDGGKTWTQMQTPPEYTHQWIKDNMNQEELMDWWNMVAQDSISQYIEAGKELFQDAGYDVEIYTGGRSAGWIEVHGLEDIYGDWPEDLVDVWTLFKTRIEDGVENFPSYFATELYYGVYEAKLLEAEDEKKEIAAVWTQVEDHLISTQGLLKCSLSHQKSGSFELIEALKAACPLLVAKVEDQS